MAFQALGYESAHHGEGRWNGVAILSRVGLDDVVAGLRRRPRAGLRRPPPLGDLRRRAGRQRLRAQRPRAGRRPLPVQARLARPAARATSTPTATRRDPLAICGDYNIAPTDDDVWDPTAFVGSTHVSEPEREALQHLEDWGLDDTFRRLRPEPGLYTYWDYRAGMFHKHQGMRIDLILATAPLADAVEFALIDRNARKGKGPSDHAPVLVDVAHRRQPWMSVAGESILNPRLARRAPITRCRRVASPSGRVADATRVLIEGLVGTDLDEATINDTAERLEQIAGALRHATCRAASTTASPRRAMAGAEPDAFFDHSPMIGRANPLAPPIALELSRRPGGRAGHLRFRLRGAAGLRARRVRRLRLRRDPRLGADLLGRAGDDGHAHDPLPEAHAARTPTSASRAASTARRAARSSPRVSSTPATCSPPRPRASSSRSRSSASPQLRAPARRRRPASARPRTSATIVGLGLEVLVEAGDERLLHRGPDERRLHLHVALRRADRGAVVGADPRSAGSCPRHEKRSA